MIAGVRIDERLVHAQVATLWVKALNVARIVVVDEKAEENSLEKSSLEMATPTGVRLSVLTVNEAAENFKNGKYDTQEILLVVRDPRHLVALVEQGVALEAINVGILSRKENSTEVTPSVYLTKEDQQNLSALANKGIKIFAQLLPTDAPLDLAEVLADK